ncbi:MAG: cysteine desulfurase [Cytophagales bacterium]|nr:cysteine desulfurase [Cytophagales bacterium]
MRVYLDNAATTPLYEEVLEAMKPYMTTYYGNPSSIHSHGREAKVAVEHARKKVATLLNAAPAEIFFTGSGTEGNNMALRGSVEALGIKHAITSPIEHHAVIHPLEQLAREGKIQLHLVALDAKGHVRYEHLEHLLKKNSRSLVSLMQANNEIGNLSDIVLIGELCKKYDAIFHSDAVQTISHFKHDLQALPVHFLVGSAHKFHGPKGVGFIYINNDVKIKPFIHGGAQEQNMRSGTENVYGIVGLSKALEIGYRAMEKDRSYIQSLKDRMIQQLKENIPDIAFNGDSEHPERSLYTVLNVSFPPSDDHDMLLFNLDIQQISASAGSACTSGSNVYPHVLAALKTDPKRNAIRFSFSKHNTAEEIDYTVEKLAAFCHVGV